MESSIKLRVLTLKSKWDFSFKNKGLTIEEVTKSNLKSILWAYLNLEKISFCQEVLDLLKTGYPDLKFITKPGVDKEQFNELTEKKFDNRTYHQLLSSIKFYKSHGMPLPDGLYNTFLIKRAKYKRSLLEANHAFQNVESGKTLQRINHGHINFKS